MIVQESLSNISMLGYTDHLYALCKARNVPCISKQTQDIITGILQDTRPTRCLEIGTAVGYSSIIIGQQIANWGGTIQSFEIAIPSYHEAMYHISCCRLDNVRVYPFAPSAVLFTSLFHMSYLGTHKQGDANGKSKYIYSNTIDQVGRGPHLYFDFVFIDARKSDYLFYLSLILPYCHTSTRIIIDDVVKYANKLHSLYEYLQKKQWKFDIISTEPGDGLIHIDCSKNIDLLNETIDYR